MSGPPGQRGDTVRVAEVIGALCLATDLGMGFPFEHGLHATIATMRLGERLGVDRPTASQAFYASLLLYSGCTTDAAEAAEIFGGDLTTHVVPALWGSPREQVAGVLRALPDPGASAPARALQVGRRLPRAARQDRPHLVAICEVARMLSGRFGLPAGVQGLFDLMTERWDGRGRLRRARGDEIPMAMRIAHVGRDAAFQRLRGGVDAAAAIVASRGGKAFDPAVAAALAGSAAEVLEVEPGRSAWDEALAWEPEPHLRLEGPAIDEALAAMGDFADLLAPHLTGHSSGVARLAAAAAPRAGMGAADAVALRRAALVHDLGRVAVDARTWQRAAPLTPDEWEGVRLHAYHTDRILSRSPFLAALAPVASAHHERLDGSGYHRGATAAALPPAARLLAAADAFHAMAEPRPHRSALPPAEAASLLGDEARAGRLDAGAVAAILEAAGQPRARVTRPAGLTGREAEVVGLLARGLQTKQIARALGISAKTADHHIQNAYGKMGVSTRAAATLFAMERGLTTPGELPMSRGGGGP
jgi:HD-GYP domain-containing protein (c-di-GMP phosphodiesterase class II)